MRVATWNVNGLTARLDLVAHWLAARRPDVVGLQEIKMTDEQFPHAAFTALGYHAASHGQKAWNGVAVLSRRPITIIQRDLPGQEELGARLIATQTAGITFATAYCPNGKNLAHQDFRRKLAWLDALADYAARDLVRAEPAILCGDLNVCPAGVDTWNEEQLAGQIFHTGAERSRFTRLLACGLGDLFRKIHPEARAFSWWDYRGGAFHRGRGLRLDFLLATPALTARVRSVEIDREYRKKKNGITPSDHAPVIADLTDEDG